MLIVARLGHKIKMYNLFAQRILEQLMDRSLSVTLAATFGETDRTWRNRLQAKWQPNEIQRKRYKELATTSSVERMVQQGGWLPEEAQAILADRPSTKLGMELPTADLIYGFSPPQGAHCQSSIELATRFDQDCSRLCWRGGWKCGTRCVVRHAEVGAVLLGRCG